MKKLFTILFICFMLVPGAQQAWAQTNTPEALKEGYGMHEGKMIHIADGTITPMEEDVTMEDGTKVMQDGTVVLPGKKPQKLREGYAVNKMGKIVLLEYDMMKPEAIQSHSQRMLGNTATQIITTGDSTIVVVDPSEAGNTGQLTTDHSRRSALISEKNSLVVQKAELMNRLKTKEIPKNEELKTINARLKQIDQELKSLEPQPAQEQKAEE
ncbi:DUF6799 domain-containing protein [Botryobacter ruber]|uniref:DUF6799 domain-containing protein n=1 Tax=Botryobacter ruber TaxID=2171629 RepID=UPI000F64CA1B|nr:DUF6799 domain-containing protein [Botryobacter ruber]